MDQHRLEAQLEALLFTYGEPLAIGKIAELLSITAEEVMLVLLGLENNLQQANRGLALVKRGDQVQLVTKADHSPLIQKIATTEFKDELTPAALETLAILAYGGPLAKTEVEYIRGVNSSHIIRNLSLRGLITKENKKYQVSFDLLRHIGLASLLELPEYQHYQELIKKFKEGHET